MPQKLFSFPVKKIDAGCAGAGRPECPGRCGLCGSPMMLRGLASGQLRGLIRMVGWLEWAQGHQR